MSDDVYIHAGSPRTGTSSFQMFLERNAGAIRAQGVDPAYPGRDGAETGTLTLRLPFPRHDAAALRRRARSARQNLAGLMTPGRPALISEENIPGRFLDIYKGLFFPTAALRGGFMAEVLAPRRVARITLVLRPYAGLFVSGYRKRSEDHAQEPFREVAPRMADFRGGWPEVVAALQESLRPREVMVLDYRRRPQAELARVVCPLLDTGAMAEPAGETNASLSDAALFALRDKIMAGVEPSRDVVEETRLAYADTPAEEPFAAFTAEEEARLDARFAEDMDRLATMEGVTVRRGA